MKKEQTEYTRGSRLHVKTMLYVYPQLGWLIEQERHRICNGAVFSYKSRYSTEKLVEKLLDESMHCDRLIFLQQVMSRVMEKLSDKHRAMVEYGYFRKKKKLKGMIENKELCLKTVYRSQEVILREVGHLLSAMGIDYEWFRENVLYYDWGVEVFRKVLMGKDYWARLEKKNEEGKTAKVG